MALQPGTRLGPYEVLSAIGAGGMGEVYKARDTRLDRVVAIKVLPAHLADKPELRERFEREARTIASLNHPHICTLYDVGHQDGTDFLVMEYLEGETLATRLMKGPLGLEQVLQYGIEISDALDKAHRKGVTHRDIKPGNIMLTKSGTKLLDFGLAKLKQQAPAISVSQLPTLSQNPTAQGTLLGTMQYMAPEQLEGNVDQIDPRTDIFAFGAVVHEMATGKKAFEGKSHASLISAIMSSEPAPISSLQPMTPPALDRVVKKCLAKEPDERWQTASDLRGELKWIAESGSQAGLPAPAALAQRPRPFGWIAAAVFLFGLAAVSFVHFREASPAAAPEMRTEIATPFTTDPVSFALSPDGRQMVFVASEDGLPRLWLRRLEAKEAQPLAGTDGASNPFWSPDSRSIGFFASSKLKRMDIGGGVPQTLADAVDVGGSWGPDGTILFTRTSNSGIFRIPASGGEPVAVTRLDRQTNHRHAKFLPDGRQFLFHANGTVPETAGIHLGSLDSAETKRLGVTDRYAAYSPDGWLFFVREGTLLAQRLDLDHGELTGAPVTVADSVALGLSISASGLVAYRSGEGSRRQLTWFDRSGKTLGTLAAPDTNGLATPDLSPDGRRAAVFRRVDDNADIWIVDATRSIRFTFDASRDQYPRWSPDGSHIIFTSVRKGQFDLYLKPSNGANNEQLLLESAQYKIPQDWSRDGKFVLYASYDPQTTWDLWVLPMQGERKPFVFLKTKFTETRAKFSPDGRWVAYWSNASGRDEIYVRPFSAGSSGTTEGSQWQVSTSGGLTPCWRPDGKELYYIAPDGKMMSVPIVISGATIEPGTPVALFQTRIVGGGTGLTSGTQYDVSGDGHFLINTILEDDASPITLLQNWNPEAKK